MKQTYSLIGRMLCVSVLVVGLGWSDTGWAAAGVPTVIQIVSGTAFPSWLRVDPQQPQVLYVGGTLGCTVTSVGDACPLSPPNSQQDTPFPCTNLTCPDWVVRSEDGGRTWSRLERPLGVDADALYTEALHWCTEWLAPLTLAPDTRRLYAMVTTDCGSAGSNDATLLTSADQGSHWTTDVSLQDYGYGGGTISVSVSPADPRRVYALFYTGDSSGGHYLTPASTDGGATWPVHPVLQSPAPTAQFPENYPQSILADPRQADVAYVDFTDGNNPTDAARTEDGGRTWQGISPPKGLSSKASFSVYIDPQLPGILFGQTTDPSVPVTRRYTSTDDGVTWQTGQCPGIRNGVCPRFILSNIFGNGASVAFQADGIYQFKGIGPAGVRLAVSDTLPVPIGRIMAVAGGAKQGDPIYLLAGSTTPTAPALIYRSTDAGKSWEALPNATVLPNQAAASTAPGSLLVPQTHHSVAAPFVATYKRLGLRIIGYPLTEPYRDGDTLVQLFQHLRLELVGAQVTTAPLGSLVFAAHRSFGDTALTGSGAVQPVPTGATLRYFPATHHTLSGDFLRFWEANGGLSVFGAPITEVMHGTNGDGSGRVYAMQYFTNARLELHPENSNPQYRVLLGLIGNEWLQYQGWTVQAAPSPRP